MRIKVVPPIRKWCFYVDSGVDVTRLRTPYELAQATRMLCQAAATGMSTPREGVQPCQWSTPAMCSPEPAGAAGAAGRLLATRGRRNDITDTAFIAGTDEFPPPAKTLRCIAIDNS